MKDDVTNGQISVRLNEKQILALKERLQQFKQSFEPEQAKFLTSPETDYYIVSRQYISDWLEYCQTDEIVRPQLKPLNYDLVDQQGQLRPGLVEAQDFEIVTQKIYKLIKPEKGLQIRRRSVVVNDEKRIPIYLDTIKYIKLDHKDIKAIDNKHRTLKEMVLKTVQFPMLDSIGNLIEAIKWNENSRVKKVRLWKNNTEDFSMERLYGYIRDKTRFIVTIYRFEGVGKLIEDEKIKLNDLNLEENDYFIAEFCEEQNNYFFKANNEAKCESCFKYKKLPFMCGCKKVAYCTEYCMEKDKKFHKDCKFLEEQEMKQQVQMIITPSSCLGLVGLSNLGNTCFMNSCLQCLSNTTLLTQYFLNRYYQNQVNFDNPLGSKGKLAKNYAKFIKAMWCNSETTFSPSNLKLAVAKLNPIFSGYGQHDSQQFFSFLADGIHEDLNRVKKKPYVESVDSKGRPDHIVAFQSWVAHTQRNQSIIVDLMTGQYKSKVVCPVCSLQSITFDPFTTVSLPIPEQEATGTLKFFIIYNNSEQEASRTSFQYSKANPKEWLESAAKLLGRPPHDFVFYVLTVFENVYSFETTPKTEILHKIEAESKHVFLLELDPAERQIKQKIELVTKFCKKSTYFDKQYDNLWFKRPFFFEKQSTTVTNVKDRLIRFLYKLYVKKMSYEDYFTFMERQKPFTLVLKYKKTTERTFSKTETSFSKQIELTNGNQLLAHIIESINANDYELDVRFTKDSVKLFEFEKLKNFKDMAGQKKQTRKHSSREASVTLDQCFNVFQQKQQLDRGNEWYCPKCKQHRLATKQMTVYKAPQILILHLKRFKNKGVIRKEKNEANVIFPMVLNMRKYLIDPEPMSSYVPELIKQNKYIQPSFKAEHNVGECEPEYDLYAISNHYGGLGGGHYTAFAKNRQKWFEFNDSSVRVASEESIKGSAAYMLFYRRRNSLKLT